MWPCSASTPDVVGALATDQVVALTTDQLAHLQITQFHAFNVAQNDTLAPDAWVL